MSRTEPAPLSNRCFCAVATRSHLRPALVLLASLRASGNFESLHLLVPDASEAELAALPAQPRLVYHGFDDISSGLPPRIRHYFDAFELSNALKPFLIARLLATHEAVVYLDTDIFAVAPFEPVWRALAEHPVLLTPHQLVPPDPGFAFTNEIEIVDQGMLNGGFTAWRAGPAADRALEWLRDRLPRHGFNDRRHGMFVDQKLLPLLVCYFPESVHIWRERSVNIAFWNAHERPVSVRDGRYLLGDGAPVLFFHLSGHRPERADVPCTYLPAAANADILRRSPWFATVMEDYLRLWLSVPPTPAAPPYPYNTYAGLALTPALRRILYRKGALRRGDPDVIRARVIHALRLLKRRLVALLPRR